MILIATITIEIDRKHTNFNFNLQWFSLALNKGPSIEYVTLEGEGVRKGVTVCDREGVKRMWRHTYKKIYHTYETGNQK